MKKTQKGNTNFYPLRATSILSHIWGFNHISFCFYDHFSNYFLRKNVHYLTIFKSIYFFEWRKNSCFRKLPLSTAHFKVTSCIYIMEIKRVSQATSSETLQTNFSQYDFCPNEGVNLSPPPVFFLSDTKLNEKDTER